MKIKSLFLLAVFSAIFGFGCNPPSMKIEEIPTCTWSQKERVVYNPFILKAPTADLPMYKYIYTEANNSIYSLQAIFGTSGEQQSSNIKVITTSNGGCSGTTSKTDLITKESYLSKVEISAINSLYGPNNSNGFPRVTVEIKSGPHVDSNGNTGYVVWSKVAPTANPYGLQNGTFEGVFQTLKIWGIVNPNDFRNKVYINGKMATL